MNRRIQEPTPNRRELQNTHQQNLVTSIAGNASKTQLYQMFSDEGGYRGRDRSRTIGNDRLRRSGDGARSGSQFVGRDIPNR